MKYKYVRPYFPWILVISSIYAFMGVLFWLADIKVFQALLLILILASIITVILICLFLIKSERKREAAFVGFLSNPNVETENKLLNLYPSSKKDLMKYMADRLYEKNDEIEKYKTMLSDYENYVEVWVHEIKLPLSLLTLVLDNKKDELPDDVCFKLDYARNQIQNNIAQILFYYRVRSEKSDLLFESIDCKELIDMVLEDYKPLLDEEQFKVTVNGENKFIYVDRRSFEFIISQIVSNSIKYCGDNPVLDISILEKDETTIIDFKDNGCGIKPCDLPYIFNKGFTGDSGELRKKSTGMGLYLVKQLSEMLKIDIEVNSEWQEGFEIILYKKSEKEELMNGKELMNGEEKRSYL